MAQTHRPDLSSLSALFRSVVEGLTDERGFVVVRTAYASTNDEAQWADALEKLRAYALPDDDDAEIAPDTFALPVVADHSALNGADFASVRAAFSNWFDTLLRGESSSDDEDNEQWPSGVRRDVCIVIDEPSIASLLNAPGHIPGCLPNLELEPWVVVVDFRDPTTVGYRGGGPYMGFMRARARVLGQLFEDLDSISMDILCPIREYDGQISLYDGAPRGKLIDPPGGAGGRYKFPRGTPRGADGARAMLAEIERAVGGTHKPDARGEAE